MNDQQLQARAIYRAGLEDGRRDGARDIWLDMLAGTLEHSPGNLGKDAPTYIAGYIAGMAQERAAREGSYPTAVGR